MVEAKGEAGKITGSFVTNVSDEELRSAFSGPAIFSNKFYATTGASGIRIAFMEALGDLVPPVFRTAIVLPYQDAFALRDMLAAQLSEIESAINQAKAEGGADAKST